MSATDEIGDGVFLLFARGARPLAERLMSIAARLEAAPRHIEEQKTRLGAVPPVRLWNEMELEAVGSLPTLFEDVAAAGRREFGEGAVEARRLEQAASAAAAALHDYGQWLTDQLADATDDFALGSAAYEELIELRAFDGLSTDDILEIGEQQLAEHRSARIALAHEIDRHASEAQVVDRVKSDHPADFEAALAAYRQTMDEARQYVIDHDLATMPAGESLDVVATPEYLRNVMPFAAYFSPPKFGAQHDRKGLYIVTPSVDGDPGAMREHNFASIYNTSIHEAYPGHHQQLTAALAHPSLVRQLVDAPEFVEGWAMYCEQMMREEGFDTAPEHQLMMHTDAIWRACRIILDVKLHRREISVADAIDFMVEQTGFERPNATAEVHRYTYTPTYQLSYLLGRCCSSDCAPMSSAAWASGSTWAASTTRCSRRAACRSASSAGSWKWAPSCASSRASTSRPADRGSCCGRARQPARARRPTDRRRSPSTSSGSARRCCTWSISMARRAAARPTPKPSSAFRAPWVCRSSLPEASTAPSRSSLPLPAVRRASSCHSGSSPNRSRPCAPCLRAASDWLAIGLDARPDRLAEYPWHGPPPSLADLVAHARRRRRAAAGGLALVDGQSRPRRAGAARS